MVILTDVQTNGTYLKGSLAYEKKVTEITIISEPVQVDTDFGKKVECAATIPNEETEYTWSMGNGIVKVLIDAFGTDTTTWIGKTIPIETPKSQKYNKRYIQVNAEELEVQLEK